MAKILGIGGVFLKTTDPGRLLSWYEQHAGLQRAAHGGGVEFPWRDGADPTKERKTVWALFDRDSAYFGPGNQQVMVNYIVDDLDGMLAALRAAGATVDDRVEDYEYGRFGWATDPEGNRLELWQPPADRS
ncbi:MAG: glyoxalase [Gemmataceae bacterium]|nr:glyoxalase [Gemmataceae bacterium]